MLWYYNQNGTRKGPYSDDRIRELVRAEEIDVDTLLEPPMGDRRTVKEAFPELLASDTTNDALNSQAPSTQESSQSDLTPDVGCLETSSLLEETSILEETSLLDNEETSLSNSSLDDYDHLLEENRPDTTNLAVAKPSVEPINPPAVTPTEPPTKPQAEPQVDAPVIADATPEPTPAPTPSVTEPPIEPKIDSTSTFQTPVRVPTPTPQQPAETHFYQPANAVHIEPRSTQTSYEHVNEAAKPTVEAPKTVVHIQPRPTQTSYEHVNATVDSAVETPKSAVDVEPRSIQTSFVNINETAQPVETTSKVPFDDSPYAPKHTQDNAFYRAPSQVDAAPTREQATSPEGAQPASAVAQPTRDTLAQAQHPTPTSTTGDLQEQLKRLQDDKIQTAQEGSSLSSKIVVFIVVGFLFVNFVACALMAKFHIGTGAAYIWAGLFFASVASIYRSFKPEKNAAKDAREGNAGTQRQTLLQPQLQTQQAPPQGTPPAQPGVLKTQTEQNNGNAPQQENDGCLFIIPKVAISLIISGAITAIFRLDTEQFQFTCVLVFVICMIVVKSSKNKNNPAAPRR